MKMVYEALAYAQRGYPVFPCDPNSKRPLVAERDERGRKIKGSGGVKLATTDVKTINSWWAGEWAGAMIAVRTGSARKGGKGGAGVFVLDLDPKGGSAEELLAELETFLGGLRDGGELKAGPESSRGLVADFAAELEKAANNPEWAPYKLPLGPRVRTPRGGGLHLYFKMPADQEFGLRVDILKGRIEQIDCRANNGYVIVPPSVRRGKTAMAEKCDGVAYEWVEGTEALEVPEAPPEVIRLVTEKFAPAKLREGGEPARKRPSIQKEGESTAKRSLHPSSSPRPSRGAGGSRSQAQEEARQAYAERALADEVERVARAGKGNRNHTLNAAALALGHLVGAGYLGEERCTEELLSAAERCGLIKDDGLYAAQATVESGMQKGMEEPRSLDHVGTRAGVSRRPPPPGNDYIRDTAPPRPRAPASGGKPIIPEGERAVPGLEGSRATEEPEEEGEAEGREDSGPAPGPPPGGSGGGYDDGPPPPGDYGGPPPEDEREPSDPLQPEITEEKVLACMRQPLNDHGNAHRLRIWFGDRFLTVDIAERSHADIGIHHWNVTHWQQTGAVHAVQRMAHRVSELIKLECDRIPMKAEERETLDAAKAIEKQMEDGELEELTEEQAAVLEKAEEIKTAHGKKAGERRKFANGSGNNSRLNAMISQALPYCAHQPNEMDSEPLAINVENGTLRLERDGDDWRLRLDPHDRADLITKCMPVKYDPEATCPAWLKFVDLVQPKEDNRNFLRMWHGLALTALTEQAFVLNYGTGANGKTTFIEAIARLQGGYAHTLPAETMVGDQQRRGDQATPELARLAGARLVRAAELPRGHNFRESVIKMLTGGDAIPVRHLHGRFWDLQPVFKAVGTCNEKPDISGVDEGIWRRVKLVVWEHMIPPEERRPMDKVLAEFDAERPGILNWLLLGLLDYLKSGFYVPPDIVEATESYRADMDPVGAFIEAHVTEAPDETPPATVTAKEFYEAFHAYCTANSIRPYSLRNFSHIVAQKGIKKKKSNVIQYLHIKLHDVPKSDYEASIGRYANRDPGAQPWDAGMRE